MLNKHRRPNQRPNGFALAEVLIATAIVVCAATALYTAVEHALMARTLIANDMAVDDIENLLRVSLANQLGQKVEDSCSTVDLKELITATVPPTWEGSAMTAADKKAVVDAPQPVKNAVGRCLTPKATANGVYFCLNLSRKTQKPSLKGSFAEISLNYVDMLSGNGLDCTSYKTAKARGISGTYVIYTKIQRGQGEATFRKRTGVLTAGTRDGL